MTDNTGTTAVRARAKRCHTVKERSEKGVNKSNAWRNTYKSYKDQSIKYQENMVTPKMST